MIELVRTGISLLVNFETARQSYRDIKEKLLSVAPIWIKIRMLELTMNRLNSTIMRGAKFLECDVRIIESVLVSFEVCNDCE